jgi:nucleoside-diphosphate-sugar epimerase
MVGYSITEGKVKILSDGTAWRPNVHVEDVSSAFVAGLKAPIEDVNGEIINVGMNSENYQVKGIAKIIASVTNAPVEFKEGGKTDPRSYNVSFNKIKSLLKEFKPKWTVKMGVEEIYNALKPINFTGEEFQRDVFFTVKHMKKLIEEKKVDDTLRLIT